MPDVLDLLTKRRSPNIPDLAEPGPDESQVRQLLTVAARVPDHGKLVPWRFIVLRKATRAQLSEPIAACFQKEHPQATPEQIDKERSRFVNSPLVVLVVSRAGSHPKIPEWEQILSAGAACMNLIVAAHAMGFAANWVTGWVAYDRSCQALLGVADGERVAGVIHIGTPPGSRTDRDRPNLEEIVTIR